MAKHTQSDDPTPDPTPAPDQGYDAAVASVAKAAKAFIDAGVGGKEAGQLAITLYCHCCGGGMQTKPATETHPYG